MKWYEWAAVGVAGYFAYKYIAKATNPAEIVNQGVANIEQNVMNSLRDIQSSSGKIITQEIKALDSYLAPSTTIYKAQTQTDALRLYNKYLAPMTHVTAPIDPASAFYDDIAKTLGLPTGGTPTVLYTGGGGGFK